ncbi:hypothetical protein [Sediminitomix flava]|uniref:hypothetical protein n=1 Tax=Sediminitomix flava TaxID=379075 RepID=UPI0011B22762|nr:hypothetical protein [Sediminitomix flava]
MNNHINTYDTVVEWVLEYLMEKDNAIPESSEQDQQQSNQLLKKIAVFSKLTLIEILTFETVIENKKYGFQKNQIFKSLAQTPPYKPPQVIC